MITKGSGNNKREEQDGWVGSIIPNDLIAQELYHEELEAIENKRNTIQDIETELADLIEAAKVEDSEENNALYGTLKKNEDDEPGDVFDNKLLKAELKKAEKGTEEYELLKKVEILINKKSSLAKDIKSEEKELKDAVEEHILVLTDEEIDKLMYKKWFGSTAQKMVALVQIPLKAELNILTMLEERYANTLDSILHNSDLEDVTISFPCRDEQERIGKVFEHLDNLITLHQRKLEKMKALKKSYITDMFPAEGERKPKLRFAGFTDDWEQRKLGEMSDSFEYRLNAAAKEFDGKNKYIRITDIDDESRRFLNSDLTSPNAELSNADNYKLKSGDILFARTGASVGKSYIYSEYDGLVSNKSKD